MDNECLPKYSKELISRTLVPINKKNAGKCSGANIRSAQVQKAASGQPESCEVKVNLMDSGAYGKAS